MLSMFLAPETKEAAKQAGQAAAKAIPKLPPLETEHSWAMPTDASNFAAGTDNLYFFILVISLFFFVLVMGAMGWFMWKYRRQSEDQKTSSITHNGKIEFLWSAIPAVLLVVIFAWGEIDFVKQGAPPPDAIDIRVTGRQWYWTVEYPDYPGVQLTSNVEEPVVTMIVPKGRPVRLTMTSEDVLHSYYIPAFRLKRDVVPGRYTNFWFEATRIGEFNLFCAEYCGDSHSTMTGTVKVLDPEQFEAAIREAGKLEPKADEKPEDFGERIYKRRGCNACHSVDGSKSTGPTWQGLIGRTETFTDGGSLTITAQTIDNYVKDSVLTPQKQVVAGYTGTNMPSYQGQLTDQHIEALVAYMKKLSK